MKKLNSLVYRFVYTDGRVVDKLFTKTEARLFSFNEGDHLVRWFPLKRVDKASNT